MTISFEITESSIIDDLKIVNPSSFSDDRGVIWTSYSSESLSKILPGDLTFKHDKFSQSKQNVLRGIHGDKKSWKFVSCVQGAVMQVVIDLREQSKTYLKWESFNLGEENRSSIVIPPGMGNAFFVTTPMATYHYKLAYHGDYIDAEDQFTIPWNDERFKISWPNNNPILSERDQGI